MELLLGLGGNLGNVEETFAWVARQIHPHAPIRGASTLYRTAPVGPPQPPFLNAALLLELHEDPESFLRRCQEWERLAGRLREQEVRWGPRPLDLDLLLVPGLVMVGPTLTLPHPRFAARAFALRPGAELAPLWVHPRLQKTLAALAAAVPSPAQDCQPLGPFPFSPS